MTATTLLLQCLELLHAARSTVIFVLIYVHTVYRYLKNTSGGGAVEQAARSNRASRAI